MFSSGKVVWKNTEAPRGEDDFSTTPAGLDLAWTKRTRVTFACGLVNSGYEEAVQSDVDLFINSLNIIPEKILYLHKIIVL